MSSHMKIYLANVKSREYFSQLNGVKYGNGLFQYKEKCSATGIMLHLWHAQQDYGHCGFIEQ